MFANIINNSNLPTIFLASDLHLERRDSNAREVILQKINRAIADHVHNHANNHANNHQNNPGNKNNNFSPLINTKTSGGSSDQLNNRSSQSNVIVVLAGDIGEGVMGLDWALNIQGAEVVYVAGNHEFWGDDYGTLLTELEARSNNTHVHFLHNREITLHGIRFAGATLWTNLGGDIPGWKRKNPAMIASAGYMRDFQRINYRSWYDNPENVLKLKEFFKELSTESSAESSTNNLLVYNTLSEEKRWNPLIEVEENLKSKLFLQETLTRVAKEPLVLVTHHLPFFQSFYERGFDRSVLRTISSRDHLLQEAMQGRSSFRTDILRLACYANNLEAIVSHRHAPVLMMHGHFHVPVDYVMRGTRIVSNPLGYQWDTQAEDFRILSLKPEPPIAALSDKLMQSLDWGQDWLARWEKMQEGIRGFADMCALHLVPAASRTAFAYAMGDHAEQLAMEANQEVKKCLQPFVRFFHPEIDPVDLPTLNPEEWLAYSKVFLVSSEDHLGLSQARFTWLYSPMISVSEHSFDTPADFNFYSKEAEFSPSWEHYASWLKEMAALSEVFQQNMETLKEFSHRLPQQYGSWKKPWPLRPSSVINKR